jgi:tRNA pseudouridine55 synthase
MTFNFSRGEVLPVDKPKGWTSNDVVQKIRTLIRSRQPLTEGGTIRVGHAGTLDPLATGLLIVCTGAMTRKISRFQLAEKEYIGSFYLGATTPTGDLESSPENFKDVSNVTEEKLLACARQLTGEILQQPPAFSAMKTAGKRAYQLARQGQPLLLMPRPVTIYRFEITDIRLPLVFFNIVCSKGTYLRSIAIDFGRLAGAGAYLASLCRVRIGDITLKQSWNMQQLEQAILNTPV